MDKWWWQSDNWPKFNYDTSALDSLEKQFLQNSGYILGAYTHISTNEQEQLKIDLLSEEAVESCAIEGQFLERSSVQTSLRRNFGLELADSSKQLPPFEQAMAYMLADLYKNYMQPLSEQILCDWHLNLLNGRSGLNFIGTYRQHSEAMQIVSGAVDKVRIHYEAPPSNQISMEMDRYIAWFNNSATLPALTRAGIAHVYFAIIHPFEDGNGRIGRAIVEKSLSQSLQQPIFSGLSRTIQKNKKQYYTALASCNKSLEITTWLEYFANTVLEAQNYVREYIDFLINKTKLYDRIKYQINDRQSKVITRILKEGLDGFKGGLSVENYLTITKTSRATATRDLQDLVAKNIFFSTGMLKSTRYFLIQN
jgi:Fic family protein